MPLATVMMSGLTPYCSWQNHVPVRPKPAWISSMMRQAPISSAIARSSCMNSVVGTMKPPSPWMGSTMMAATSSP